MKILVIGHSGQVARALTERAADTGVAVTAVGRPEVDLLVGATARSDGPIDGRTDGPVRGRP